MRSLRAPAGLLLVLGLLAVGACGGDEPQGPPAAEPPLEATGSPDGEPAAPRTPEALLERLRARIARGDAMSDETWSRDVQTVAVALWPGEGPDLTPEAGAARQTHTNLAHIAGDVARALAHQPGAREDWDQRDPGSLVIHDALLEEAGRGVDAYRAWIETDGARLMRERIDALLGGR